MNTLAPRVLLVAALLCSVTAASAGDTVRAVRYNRDVNVAEPARLAAKLVALLESCSVNSTAYAVSNDTWTDVLASHSFIHVIFTVPRLVKPKSEGEDAQAPPTVREILLPLPNGKWPEHILVKSDERTLSFTKYDPSVLRDIVRVRELQLQGVRPYDSLPRLSYGQSLLPTPALNRTGRDRGSFVSASARPAGELDR